MAYTPIANSEILWFNSDIADLDDQPNLSAQDLKAYFDKNPYHLRSAHNILVRALIDPRASAQLGFKSTAGVPADTIQDAIVNVQQQLSDAALGSIPDGSISAAKLNSAVQQTLSQAEKDSAAVTALQQKAETIRPSGAQFPLMVLALTDGCPSNMTDELATAALGGRLPTQVHDLGEQLAWLCQWKSAETPSAAFQKKQTINQIFSDSGTLAEIRTLDPVYNLISLSAEMLHAYRTALDNA